jgi:hypothetical protein
MNFSSFTQKYGIHPLTAMGMFAVDSMLFLGEGLSGGVTWPISVGIAAVFAGASFLLQRGLARDDDQTALGKAILLGLLTAIPTALPTALMLPSAALGVAGMLFPKQKPITVTTVE